MIVCRYSIIFNNSKYVQDSSSPNSRTDENRNTFQIRKLKSGEKFKILKNIPKPEGAKNIVIRLAERFEWITFYYFWILKFRKKQ